MLRRSRRLRGSPPPPEDSTESLLVPPHTSHSAQIPVVKRISGLSALSTDSEDAFEQLVSNAIERLKSYRPANRENEELIEPFFRECLNHLPPGGATSIARGILESETDDALYQSYQNLVTCLVLPMKARKSEPVSSPREKSQRNAEIVFSTLLEPQPREDRFRDECLHRDNHRCVVTGYLEVSEWNRRGSDKNEMSSSLEAAHIIPYAYGSWTGSPQKPSEIWEALFRCFPGIRQIGMHAEQINNIFNGVTLQQCAHMEFGNLRLAFVPQPDPHTYEVKLYPQCQTMVRMIIGSERKIVTFTKAPGAENLPLPCRALLDAHYRLAEILHASGMGEFIDQKIRDWEKMKNGPDCHQLRADGGTDLDKILRTALWGRVTAG